MKSNNIVLAQANKSKIKVITEEKHYASKVTQYIRDNNLTPLTEDPIVKFERTIISTTNPCKDAVSKETEHKYYNPNPSSPTIRALVKFHRIL
jgi:hypothetical protein